MIEIGFSVQRMWITYTAKVSHLCKFLFGLFIKKVTLLFPCSNTTEGEVRRTMHLQVYDNANRIFISNT